MDEESTKDLNKVLDLVKENNKMLRKIRRGQKRSQIVRIAYWLIIIGISVGAYYYIQPYINMLQDFTGEARDTLDNIKNIQNEAGNAVDNIRDLF